MSILLSLAIKFQYLAFFYITFQMVVNMHWPYAYWRAGKYYIARLQGKIVA